MYNFFELKTAIKVRLGSGEGQMMVRWSGECQVNVWERQVPGKSQVEKVR